MPRTSMLESLLRSAATTHPTPSSGGPPPPSAGTALAAGASRLVEAATTEDALAQVSERFGPDARIVDARRVRRGGVGGFFAKEAVQLHVATSAAPGRTPDPVRVPDRDLAAASARRSPERAPAATSPARSAPKRAAAASSPVDRLLAGFDDPTDDVDFATYLRDQLATTQRDGEPAAGPPPTDDPMPWTPPAVEAPRASDGSGWSRDALLRIGLPAGLVRSLVPPEPADDLAWTTALTEALRPLCRPLPSGPSVLVGPRADRLELADADVFVARSALWCAAVSPQRWVQLVVGGQGWRDGLDADPIAVSWAHDDDLADAIRVAAELGLVLGYGPGKDAASRARPFELALRIRTQVVDR